MPKCVQDIFMRIRELESFAEAEKQRAFEKELQGIPESDSSEVRDLSQYIPTATLPLPFLPCLIIWPHHSFLA